MSKTAPTLTLEPRNPGDPRTMFYVIWTPGRSKHGSRIGLINQRQDGRFEATSLTYGGEAGLFLGDFPTRDEALAAFEEEVER